MIQDIDRIKAIIAEMSERYAPKGGAIEFAGIDGNVVKVAPSGFCWR
jgi:hypothetical protein